MARGQRDAPAGVLDGWIQYVLKEDEPEMLAETAQILCDIHLGLPELTERAWARVLRNGGLIYEVLFGAMQQLMRDDREHESFSIAQRWKVPLVARPYIDQHRKAILGRGREELELNAFYAAFDTLCEGVRQIGAATSQEELARAIQWTRGARHALLEALDQRAVFEPIQAFRLGRIVPADELIDALHDRGGAVCLLDFLATPKGMLVHLLGRLGNSVEIRAIVAQRFTLDYAFEIGRIYDSYVVRKADPDRIEEALDHVCDLLHNRLWCPAAQELGKRGFSQIILIPDAWTRPFPHHLSKVCGKEVQVPEDVPVVQRERIADLFPLEIAPSAQTVAISQWQLRPRAIDTVLMIADPNEDLPSAAWTGRWLGTRLSKDITYTRLVGAEARRAAILEEIPKAQIVVFGGHGDYDEDDPLQSQLSLSDGALTLADVLDGRGVTPGAVYVLSACELGTGTPGEAIRGSAFPGALLAGGAACVLAALWEMEDTSFGYLTERFLHYLSFPGYRPAAALFRAMNDTKQWSRADVREHLRQLLDWLEKSGRANAQPDDHAYLVKLLAWVEEEAGEQPFRDPIYWGGAVVFGSGWATQSGAHITDHENPMRLVEVMLQKKGPAIQKLIRERRYETARERLDEWLAWAHGPERIEPCALEADLAHAVGYQPRIVAGLYSRLALLSRAHGNKAVEAYALQSIERLRKRG